MPLPRLDFEVHNKPGQIVFTLEIDPGRLRGARPTFGAILYLPLAQPYAPSGANGTHRPLLLGGSVAWRSDVDGLAVPAQPLLFNRNEITVPVNDEQLLRLEANRAGGDITLTLRFWGLAEQVPSGPVEAVTSGNFALPISIPRDRWLEVLSQCGFGKRRIIELPAAPIGHDGWEAAGARLGAASRELAAGRSGASLVETRVALERLADALGADLGIAREKNSFANYVNKLANKLEELDGERKDNPHGLVAQLIKTAFAFASDPPHQGLDRAARDDAELTLATVTTLYYYLARQPIRLQNSKAANAATS